MNTNVFHPITKIDSPLLYSPVFNKIRGKKRKKQTCQCICLCVAMYFCYGATHTQCCRKSKKKKPNENKIKPTSILIINTSVV